MPDDPKMHIDRAIAYVQTRGDAVERARLAAIVWDEPPTETALQELAALQRPDGGFAYWVRETSWIALPMLAFYPGPDSEPFRRALAVVEASFSPDWEGAYLAWLLRCLQDAELPATHPLVARRLADLERKQRPDGSWEPEKGEGEAHAVNATVAALRALRAYRQT
jgi:hypothetical protein